MKNSLLYAFFDTIILVFALILAISVGNLYQPQPIVFLMSFFATGSLLYYLWLTKIKEEKTPWLRLLAHFLVLLFMMVFLVSVAGIILKDLSTKVFWFLLVPPVNILVSLILSRFLKLYPEIDKAKELS